MEATPARDVRGALPPGLADAIRETAAEIAALLRGRTETGGPVPGSTWTLGEAAAHLAQANELMADIASGRERSHGDGTAPSLAAANEHALARFGERAGDPLADMIVAQADVFLGAAQRRAADETVATPLGPMNMAVFGSYLLTHMLGHGYDLARAVGRPHMVDRARAELALPFMFTVMPHVVDAAAAGLTARFGIRLRGGTRFTVTFTDGAAAVSPRPEGRTDCTIQIEPVTFLLIALGRCDPWGAIARGRILAWGRKPWLAPRFPTLFKAP
ncbi:maleylpyruvate isomerase family mycothiol-dependent enzyme [Streptomyces sp. NPDC058463]|uniref:maleylpyruvate isomerase family mycothiol-dependent enzyme n=1 Tax=Streptomyces sp. NPDC058463 TaxID=3346510 RepID=UPI0036581CA9